MAIAPIDYTVGGPSTSDALASGLNVGTTLANNQIQQQTQQFGLQQKEIAARRLQQQQADTAALSALPNPTAKDYAALVTKYPELKDSYAKAWDAVSTEQQQQKLDTAAPVFAALQSGRPDLATDLLQKQLDALKNSGGNPKDIQAAETWLKMVQASPEHAAKLGGVFLASVMGPAKFEAAFGKIGENARADTAAPFTNAKTSAEATNTLATAAKTNAETPTIAPKANAEIANLTSQVIERAARLGLDQDKLESETAVKIKEIEAKYNGTKMSPTLQKSINESAGASVIAANQAAQMRGLADQFEKADAAGGVAGLASEKFKELTGSQEYMTQLRREYTRIRATSVNALLPPGPASDKDILNAQAGFLKETANPATIASWLRGMAKLQDYQAKYENARTEWSSEVGHLGRTPKDIEVSGVKVPAGMTFPDFMKQVFAAPGPATTPPGPRGDYMKKYGTKNKDAGL